MQAMLPRSASVDRSLMPKPQDAKHKAVKQGGSAASRNETGKLPIASKHTFHLWNVTGLDEAEDEGWGMAGQRSKVKKWARPAVQRNRATATINHRLSLVFQGECAW